MPLLPNPGDASADETSPRSDATSQPSQVPDGQRTVAVLVSFSVLVSLVTSGAVGWMVGVAAASSRGCERGEMWCGLNRFFVGAFAGGLAGIVTYVAVGVIVIAGRRPPGCRSGPIALHICIPPIFLSGMLMLSLLLSSGI